MVAIWEVKLYTARALLAELFYCRQILNKPLWSCGDRFANLPVGSGANGTMVMKESAVKTNIFKALLAMFKPSVACKQQPSSNYCKWSKRVDKQQDETQA
jgi:hypothetical protein